jgi:dihydrofolate reductase
MTMLTCDITMSLDGFVAGPDPSLSQPLGAGGDRLHQWAYDLESWREPHGLPGGTAGNRDAEVMAEAVARAGATIMGRRMFGGGDGPWDESWQGWWGDEPPFHHPVFVLTHHPRGPLVMGGGTTFTFVTEGIEPALEQARAAAGGRDVAVGGGAETIQQYLRAGLLDELQVHVAPILLGGGTRLFDGVGPADLEITRTVESPAVTHIRYRVVR